MDLKSCRDHRKILLCISIKVMVELSILCLLTQYETKIVFCCYSCLDLPWEKVFTVKVTCFPSSWKQENCVEKRLCKFAAKSQEFVTFSRHFSCLRELEKEVTNIGKNFAHGTNLDNHSYIQNVFFSFSFGKFSSCAKKWYFVTAIVLTYCEK